MSGLGIKGETGIVFQDERKNIIENVERILTTRPGERVGRLGFGSLVSTYIFEPERSIDDLFNEIKRSVEFWESRVSVEECSLLKNDEDMIEIELRLKMKSNNDIIDTKVSF